MMFNVPSLKSDKVQDAVLKGVEAAISRNPLIQITNPTTDINTLYEASWMLMNENVQLRGWVLELSKEFKGRDELLNRLIDRVHELENGEQESE